MEMRHGTVVELARGADGDGRDDLPLRVVDRGGAVQATFEWDGRTLVALAVPATTAAGVASVVVGGHVIAHPLLGDAHVIEVDGAPVTVMSAIAWARPTEIPTIAAPSRVPAGAGGAIINAIALLAARAGVAALRYAGPYPTPALWRTLARSFHARGGDEALFTADVVDRAVTLARDPIAIDFVPAPFERVALAGGDLVDLRDGVERASLAGVTYAIDGSPACLVEVPDGWSAELWFGDGPWAHVARLSRDGAVVDGPHAIPAVTSSVLGREFPDALRAELASLVSDVVPTLLAHDARTLVAARPLVWADLGARAARATDTGFAVHAALWERIAPLGLPRLALALAEALAPVVTGTLLAAISQRGA